MDDTRHNITLRSERARNVIGQIPPLVVRMGISVMFLILLLLVLVAAFVSYQPTLVSTTTLLRSGGEVNGYFRLPVTDPIPDKGVYCVRIKPKNLNFSLKGKVDLANRQMVVNSNGVYYQFVAYLDVQNGNDHLILEYPLDADVQINLPVTSLLHYLLQKLF